MTCSAHSWIRPIGWLLVLTGGHAGALGADLLVPKDFPTIQSAIGAAGAGDQVIVEPGVYNEAINLLGKPITVRSTNPNDHNVVVATVIDATGLANSVVSCKSGETGSTVIMGLTLTGGTGSKDTSDEIAGGGAHIFKSSPQFIRCRFVDNSAVEDGGGLYVDEGGAVTLQSCAFLDNVAFDDGGAIAIRGGGAATIVDCVFANNAAADDGGAIRIRAGFVQITGSWFMDNSAGDQGGALFFHDQDAFATIAQSVFCGNSPNNITGPFSSGGGNLSPASCNLDTDGDGLLDTWEITGRVVLESGMVAEVDLPGANPMRKNLYVEVDAMSGFSLSDDAVEMLEFAFETAPVPNPDGSTGVTLHLLRDETDLPHEAEWDTQPPNHCWPVEFEIYREFFYGTEAEREALDVEALLEAKSMAYRYCIIADKAAPKRIGGCGETPGDNFVVFRSSAGSTTPNEAAVFMHELGHNLGLHHGGCEKVNGKPNYPSIMNYTMSYKYNWNDAFWKLDYSRAGTEDTGFGIIDDLNEASLNEIAGIGAPANFYSDFQMPFGVNELLGGEVKRVVRFVRLNGSATDFGDTSGDGFQDGSFGFGIVQDLNYVVDPPPGVSLPSAPSPNQPLKAHNDWAKVSLPLAATLGASAPAPEFPDDELTEESINWIDKNFPPPPVACAADLDGDGSVGVADLLQLLGSWGPCASCPADLTGDGNVGVADLLQLLGAWGSCSR